MKIISKTIKLLPLFLMALAVFSCNDDDDNGVAPPVQLNIVQTASASADLTSLVDALGAADGDLVDVLNGSGPFTVLAPTNAAFATFLSENGFDSLDDVPTDVLEQILLNHVISDDLKAADLVALGSGYNRTNADSPSDLKMSIYFNTSSGVRFNGVSSVTDNGADIDASNGTVHIVDAVIGLPTVTTFAVADPTFSTLVTALTTLTPATDFVATLSTANGTSPAPFTVFAPTNDAFNALDAIPEEDVLTQVLLHHVLGSTNVTSADLISEGASPTMLNGQAITISLPGTGDNIADVTDGAGNTDIGIIVVDVQASNGVIHALNKVMLPASE